MRLDRLGLVGLVVLVLGVLSASTAEAQCDPVASSATCNLVGADGKGVLGGLVLGAEIGFMANALIISAGARELDEWWAWILFPALGAVGGSVAGYYGLEEPNAGQGFPEAAVAVFAISMALIVPTFVGVLALTAYAPGPDEGGGATGDEDDGSEEEDGGGDTRSAEPDAAAEPEAARQSARERVLAGGPGALRFDEGRILLGIPMIGTTDSYTAQERAHMPLPRSADVRVPVVSGTF